VVGPLDVHPSQSAIVVHYDIEALVVNEYGEVAVADRKSAQKVINVKGLNSSSDVKVVARELVARCDFIDPSRILEVEQLLTYLKTRQPTKGPLGEDTRGIGDPKQKVIMQPMTQDVEELEEKANLAELDNYMELLYEDIPSRVKGTGLILQLARVPDNLQELAMNDALLLALARVFRDDWKKSFDLAINIVYIFFCFSTFTQFHSLVTEHKIGSLCMAVLDHEIKRHHQLTEDMDTKRREGKSSGKAQYEKARKKYQQVIKKQETLLRVTLYLLLNLAEDLAVELKMRNRGIVPMLLTLLDRKTPELVIMAVTFLKKLSVFVENKDDMAEHNILKKLIRLIPHEHEILLNMTLRLLLNLSFDIGLCDAMVKEGLLPKLVALLGNESERILVLCILYHISISDKCRPMFSLTDCTPLLMKMISESTEEHVEAEVVALGINLACHPLNAQKMAEGPGLAVLVRRAVTTRDHLLLKMVRNITQHEDQRLKRLFLDFIPDFGNVIVQQQDDQLVVEALGILGNLTLMDLDYLKIIEEFRLLPFISSVLQAPKVEDDVTLEVIILVGTLSIDETTASVLASQGIIELLIDLLKDKQEDDELVLQVIYVFYQMTTHTASRTKMIKDTNAPEYLIELMNDKNKEVSKSCNKALDILLEYDEEVAQKVQLERFRRYNALWLSMVHGEIPEETDVYGEDDDYLDPYYHLQMVDALDQSDFAYDEEVPESHPGDPRNVLYTSPVDMQPFLDGELGFSNLPQDIDFIYGPPPP
jgi:hypothetical protein